MSGSHQKLSSKIYLTIGGVVWDGLILVPYNYSLTSNGFCRCAWLGHPLLRALKQMSHQAKRRFGDETFSQNWWMLKIPIDEDIFDMELMKIRRLTFCI